MAGYVDLHCHWVPSIDDGARTMDEGREILRRLGALGFSHVVATPHMRPGMFDNEREGLENAYLKALIDLGPEPGLPKVSLGAEHYFSEEVLARILAGDALPYTEEQGVTAPRKRGAILVEFHDLSPQNVVEAQLFRLQTEGYIPVIAHPERYRAVWADPEKLARLVDLGSFALMDLAAVTGKYGREAEHSAKKLLELGIYHAACSDSHRPDDVVEVERAMGWLRREYGEEELDFLLKEAPSALLAGQRPKS